MNIEIGVKVFRLKNLEREKRETTHSLSKKKEAVSPMDNATVLLLMLILWLVIRLLLKETIVVV